MERVRTILEGPIARAAAPGGVLLFGDQGRDVATIPFGVTLTRPADRAEPVTADTIYDLASVTKIVSNTAVLLKLIEAGTVELDTPAHTLVPELRSPGSEAITLRHLAGHGSGLPPHFELFRRILAGMRDGADTPRDALIRMCGGAELEAAPGTRVVYSDLGYILLGVAMERATGKRLDVLLRELVTEPLGMEHTTYVDLHADPPAPRPAPVAPTEICPYRGLLIGEVHDGNAHSGGGVFGHAGVFATAADLGRFARAIIAAANDEPDSHFSHQVVTTFFNSAGAPGDTRRLGWDTPSSTPGVSHAGDRWPRQGSFGHLGYTGTSLWHHHPSGRYAVLLTNRVNPTRLRTGIKELRRAVMDAIWDELPTFTAR
jgi:CubicO group peptidase (beta-lactamase class C family)